MIGHDLGFWLRSFHDWGTAPEQAALRAQMWQNNPMRKVKYCQTYGSFLRVLDDFPELLVGHQKTLVPFQYAMANDFQKPSTDIDEGWGLVHGDFWSGK